MTKFVFTPELTKEDAQRIIDALMFQALHQKHASQVSRCAENLGTKELIKKLKNMQNHGWE